TRSLRDWSSDVCSSDLFAGERALGAGAGLGPRPRLADGGLLHLRPLDRYGHALGFGPERDLLDLLRLLFMQLALLARGGLGRDMAAALIDRKSTRLNSSHVEISYAVFCLKKKKSTTSK